MKPPDVKSSTYIDFNKENNKGDPKFEVGDHVKIFLRMFTWVYNFKINKITRSFIIY